MPKISIIMPVFNGEQYIKEAIDSIINQTFTDWEFLIINEFGSNRVVTDILNEYAAIDSRIKIIQNNRRLRIAASMNVGLDMAQGEYIARMDADDIAMPQRFERQIEFMDKHPEVGLLGIKPTIFGEEDWEWNAESDSEQIKSDGIFYLPCLHPTVMMRAKVLKENNLKYNPEYYCTEDYDLFDRMLQHTKASNILDKSLFYYRRYSSAATYANGNRGDEIYRIVMQRVFERLNLNFSEDEIKLLYIHDGIKGKEGKQVEEDMITLDLLLKKIFFANEKYHLYDRKALSHTLHKRYKEAYETLSWKCTSYNKDKIDHIYRNSIFANEYFYEPKVKASKKPLISVIMPTFRSEDYVADTIWSILNQTCSDFEFLILNEFGNDDDTVIIANSFNDPRIKVIQNKEKLGLADSLNYGFKIAKGKYLARVDADDIYSPFRFEKQVDFLEKHPEYGVCGTWQHHFGLDTEWIHRPPVEHDKLKAAFIYNCELCHSTLMLRRDEFINYQLFYDKAKHAEDYELWIRAIENIKFTNLPEVLSEYRVGENNITASKLDKLQQESGEITADIITRKLNVQIPLGHIQYMGGWDNQFTKPKNQSIRKELLRTERNILQQMWDNNQKLQAYDNESLLEIINRRWLWATNCENIAERIYNLEELFELFGSEKKINRVVQETKKKKMTIKRIIKKLLFPFYHPFKIRIVDKIHQILAQVWDIDGHLKDSEQRIRQHMSDVDGHMWDYYSDLKKTVQLQSDEINKLNESLSVIQESINSIMEEYAISMLAKLDEKVISLESNLVKAVEARVSNAEQNIRQTTDARIWEAERSINQTTNARIWEAERSINQTTDARIWQAEQSINQTTDARIWKAEENIINTTDARVWKLESQELVKLRGDIWNLSYKIGQNNEDGQDDNFIYNSYFYEDNRYTSYRSAFHVLKVLLPIIKPSSICDFGCGTGTWLYAAKKFGVTKVLGLDGNYIKPEWLMINEQEFMPVDLSQRIEIKEKYELAISLEVAEHISEEYADIFVQNICNTSDIILFSAAHVGQGGDGHINEQPMEYWIQKFKNNNFEHIEIRQIFKDNYEVCEWYRQNISIYVNTKLVNKIKPEIDIM